MAEGDGNETQGINDGTLGSDLIFDFYCELCKDDGKNVEAEGFCVDCGEYLCGVCYSSHQRTRQTRHHQLLDKDKMAKDTPLSSDQISKTISTTCKLHAGELVKYYCKTHDGLKCNTCFMTCQRSCPEVQSILQLSENILDSQEYADLIKTLESLDEKARDIIAKTGAYTNTTKECYTKVIESIKLLRQNVIRILDSLEQEIVKEADTLLSEEERKMTTISNNCGIVAESIKAILADFQSLQSSRRVCQVYISMKERSEHIKTLQDKIFKAEEALVLRTFKLKTGRNFQNFINYPPAFGELSSDVQRIVDANKSVVHVADIPLDTGERRISGSAVLLTQPRCVAVHTALEGGIVKVLGNQPKQPIRELKVPGCPKDCTAIGIFRAAVTLKCSMKVLLLDVSDKVEITKEISTSGWCCGVAYSERVTFNDDKLVISYTDPPKLEIRNLSGQLKGEIIKDKDGNQLFQCPEYVCVGNDSLKRTNDLTIYVSDTASNELLKVTCSLRSGGVVKSVKSVYTGSELRSPQVLCADHHGNVYVYDGGSRNVYMLTDNLTKSTIILAQADGLYSGVWSLSHCEKKNRLYVGTGDKVKVLQLS